MKITPSSGKSPKFVNRETVSISERCAHVAKGTETFFDPDIGSHHEITKAPGNETQKKTANYFHKRAKTGSL